MAKKTNPNLIGLLVSGLVVALAPLIGLVITVLSLQGAFRQTSSVDPSEKARVLSEGISDSMNATAYGIVVSTVAIVSMVVFAVRLYRDSKKQE